MTQDKCSCGCKPSIKDSTKERYENQWGRLDERVAADRRREHAFIADPLLRVVMPFTGKTLVDLGMGTGSMSFRAAELSAPARLVGVDFSTHGLSVSRAVARSEQFSSVDVEVVLGDLERIPLADKCADVVLSQATFNLLPDKRAGMLEMSRIAKPGARVALSDAFRTTRKCGDEPWEACIAGAMTVADFSTLALSSGLIVSQQIDLTRQVKQMISSGKWDWPEFIQHKMDYRAVVLLRA